MLNANVNYPRGVASTVVELPVSLWSATPVAAAMGAGDASLVQAALFQRETAAAENLALVRLLARQLHARLPQHVELDDLVSAGMVGLLDAVARFDGEKKVQFRSYAQFRIRGAMMDSLRAADWSPRVLRRQGRLIEQAKSALVTRGIQAPNDQQISEEMGVSLAVYQHLLADLKGLEIGSLQIERNEEVGEQLIESIPGPVNEDPLFRCLQGELREKMVAAIETLPEKERLVLSLYYHEELTMKEIAQVLGVVGSRVSQLHASAIRRLQNAFQESGKTTTGKSAARRMTQVQGISSGQKK